MRNVESQRFRIVLSPSPAMCRATYGALCFTAAKQYKITETETDREGTDQEYPEILYSTRSKCCQECSWLFC